MCFDTVAVERFKSAVTWQTHSSSCSMSIARTRSRLESARALAVRSVCSIVLPTNITIFRQLSNYNAERCGVSTRNGAWTRWTQWTEWTGPTTTLRAGLRGSTNDGRVTTVRRAGTEPWPYSGVHQLWYWATQPRVGLRLREGHAPPLPIVGFVTNRRAAGIRRPVFNYRGRNLRTAQSQMKATGGACPSPTDRGVA